mmetsp:Transcript_22847/g.57206  ORF Transcript_22847/g.57206 Transcript_22847/m.57206 type:complete len:369 (+) Transcript_22847:120-1226(+)|eukprot:CAMPEP_0173438540 /NCGR_PEP_ID=MMETSP1357-20121228/20470_1 /TAXON_ID=77926 /ORGANISM="Hemiselmis rufescens, Strain PCC563" /LENGTH=368 /DNA_ID=CAMNT_0014403843 /DNA_START=108 /DNA_END=1214 /DNA_ORIENTATION=-
MPPKPAAAAPAAKPSPSRPSAKSAAAPKPGAAKPGAAAKPQPSASAPGAKKAAAGAADKKKAEFSEEEVKHRVVLCKYDEDQDDALSLKELARLIKDVAEEECQFCQDHELGPYIQRAMKGADKDGDKKLNLAEFVPWHSEFRGFIDGIKNQEVDKKQAEATAHAEALKSLLECMDKGVIGDCRMGDLPAAIEASIQRGKTPLLVDATVGVEGESFSPLETFYSYSGDALIEMKKLVVDVNIQKEKTLEEAMEGCRKKLVEGLKYGKGLIVLMSNSAPPLKSKFTSAETLPIDVFDASKVKAVLSKDYREWGGTFLPGVIDAERDKCPVIHKDFKVVVVTKFSPEDYAEFLGEEVPLPLMQPIRVVNK